VSGCSALMQSRVPKALAAPSCLRSSLLFGAARPLRPPLRAAPRVFVSGALPSCLGRGLRPPLVGWGGLEVRAGRACKLSVSVPCFASSSLRSVPACGFVLNRPPQPPRGCRGPECFFCRFAVAGLGAKFPPEPGTRRKISRPSLRSTRPRLKIALRPNSRNSRAGFTPTKSPKFSKAAPFNIGTLNAPRTVKTSRHSRKFADIVRDDKKQLHPHFADGGVPEAFLYKANFTNPRLSLPRRPGDPARFQSFTKFNFTMKFKSAIITDASGSLGGATFSKNKGGLFVRARIKGTNPQSDAQTAQRGQFAAISAAWRGLIDEQRAAWEAATAYFPYQDKLGQTKNYSGAQLYSKLNGGIRSATPGASLLTLPPSPVAIPTMTVTGFTATRETADMGFAGSYSPSTVPTGFKLVLYATAGISAGISSPQNSAYKKIQTINAAGTVEVDSGAYIAANGLAATGSKVFISGTLISTVTGQMGEVFNASAIVEAA